MDLANVFFSVFFSFSFRLFSFFRFAYALLLLFISYSYCAFAGGEVGSGASLSKQQASMVLRLPCFAMLRRNALDLKSWWMGR